MTTENEALEGTVFTPFVDTDEPRIQKAIISFASATQGIDTTEIDRYRQGVSIKTSRHRFGGTQPKIWAGNLSHFVRVITFGQARSFTEFENSALFEELPRFNPVWYIEDPDYPRPITFNDGPQQEEEASLEPFTIPFRRITNEGPHFPRSVKGSLEDGNAFDNLEAAANRIEQFIEYNEPITSRFFLDEGQSYFGDGPIEEDIIIEGFTPINIRNIDPFDDTKNESIVERIQTSDSVFVDALKNLDFDLSEDIRGTFSKKSATAGGDVYGPESARYGTDSIAYRGFFRGA